MTCSFTIIPYSKVTKMPDQTSTIMSKGWDMCTSLRNNGMSNGDYLE